MKKVIVIVFVFFVAGCAGDDKQTSSGIETGISGETLFKNNCASCHKPDMDFTAPALKGSLQRWGGDKKVMYDFIRNPFLNESKYAIAIKKKWAPYLMTAFPMLTDADLDAIMQYVENYKATR